MKHGTGIDFFANGDKYGGHYKMGRPHGEGKYTWTNGSFYEGEFRHGLKEGKGKWKKFTVTQNNSRVYPVSLSGSSAKILEATQFLFYEGEYYKDKKHGYGEFSWATGNTYKGEYRDDEREGHGEMRWTDNSCYIGEWIRGIQHGYGKICFPDGSEKEGYFENNMYIGPLPREGIKMTKNNSQKALKQRSTV